MVCHDPVLHQNLDVLSTIHNDIAISYIMYVHPLFMSI